MKKINTAIIGFGVVGKRRKLFYRKKTKIIILNIYLILHSKIIFLKKK